MKKTEKIPAHFSAPARTVPSSRGAKLRAAFLSAAALSAVTENILFLNGKTQKGIYAAGAVCAFIAASYASHRGERVSYRGGIISVTRGTDTLFSAPAEETIAECRKGKCGLVHGTDSVIFVSDRKTAGSVAAVCRAADTGDGAEKDAVLWDGRKRFLFFGIPCPYAVYRITGNSLMLRTGRPGTCAGEIPLRSIGSLSLRRTPVQRLFGLGTVTAESGADGSAEFIMENIRDSVHAKNLLSAAAEKEREEN